MDRVKDIIKILIERNEIRRRLLDNLPELLKNIKEIVRKVDRDGKVILFGSLVKGRHRPDSDIDIIIISRFAKHMTSG